MAALSVLVLLAGAILLWQRPWAATDEPAGVIAIPADVSARLTTQLRSASAATSELTFVEAFGSGPKAAAFGRTTWASLKALGATDVDLRYISGGDVADREDGSASAVAEVSWRPGADSGLDPGTQHRASVALRVQPQSDGTIAIVDAAPRSGILPVWLIGAVTVDRVSDTVVLSIDGGQQGRSISAMTARARATVVRTLPEVTGQVVVVSPHTQQQMAQVVGQQVDAVVQIAAVTTRLDVASASPRDAVIVLNPAVFATMDERATQVVLSHEATHQLTGAVGTKAETWVVEGFADYVALRGDTAPLETSAGQILAEVKAGRLPAQLPDSAAFDAAGHGLGAVYESAWLAFRMLAEQQGNAKVVSFYQSVLAGTTVPAALRDGFGLTERQLTAQWRNYLTKSASTVS